MFNALDNLDARRHVNRMCLAANVPLIESGTTGFEGQVQVIMKGKTECYDCNPKPTPKSFPVCTIRSTPSQPIHCIVWAKSYLFQEIFGTSEEDETILDHSEDAQNAEEVQQLQREAGELKSIRQSMGSEDFAKAIFSKVFDRDIERLRSMEDMWTTRTPPNALKWDQVSALAEDIDGDNVAKQDQITWTQAQSIAVFNSSLARLSSRLKAEQMSDPKAVLSFDKDDRDTLDFVAATSNLRSAIFGIEPKSEFDIKQMAGNIIPAIATTNAMTASLCVVEAFKILRDQIQTKAKMVFLAPRNPVRLANSEPPRSPNKDCAVCSVAVAELQVDTDRAKLSDIVEGVLKGNLAYTDEISVSTEHALVYDPEFDDNLEKNLADLKVTDGATLTVIDEDDGEEITEDGPNKGVVAPRVNLSLMVKYVKASEDGPTVVLSNKDIKIERRPRKAPESAMPDLNGVDQGQKRKRAADSDDLEVVQPAKKAKPTSDDDDLVLVDDQKGDGAIVID